MQDRHEPSDRFIERLGHEIGTEVRRRHARPAATSWRDVVGLKMLAAAAALVIVSMAVGGAVVAAAYQNENREQRAMLASVYERKIQIEQLKLNAAKQQLQDAERKVAVGIIDQVAAYEVRQGVVEAEANLRIAMLNLEEVRATGREPRDEISAPAVPNRDFVRERITAGIAVTQGALQIEKLRLQAAERRVSVGLAQAGELDILRGRIVELESALNAAQQKMSARDLFLNNKYDSTLADLRVAEIEAEQRYQRLMPQLDLARRDMQRAQTLVEKGLLSQVEVTKANLKVLEIQTELQRAELELAIARQKIAERTGGKGAGS